MTAEGLWTITYRMGPQAFSMVATITGNKITGGNNCYYYNGDIAVDGDSLTACITGHHYFGQVDPAIGGLKEFTLKMNAKLGAGMMQGTAKVANIPVEIAFTGEKRNEVK